MAVSLPTVALTDLEDLDNLPRKVRNVEPVKSPYQSLIQGSMDQGNGDTGKTKSFPGEYSLTAAGDSKTSEFTAITRELGRAARQMGLRVKTRKIVNADNADMVKIVFAAFRDAKDTSSNAPKDAPKSETNGTPPVATPAPVAGKPAAKPAATAPVRQGVSAR